MWHICLPVAHRVKLLSLHTQVNCNNSPPVCVCVCMCVFGLYLEPDVSPPGRIHSHPFHIILSYVYLVL